MDTEHRINALEVDPARGRFAIGRRDGLVVVADLGTSLPVAVRKYPHAVARLGWEGDWLRVRMTSGQVERFATGNRPPEGGGEAERAAGEEIAPPNELTPSERAEVREVLGELADGVTCLHWLEADLLLTGHDHGEVRLTRAGTGGKVAAVTTYGVDGRAELSCALGGPNPGMWPFLRPPPGEAGRMRAKSQELAAWILEQLDAGGSNAR